MERVARVMDELVRERHLPSVSVAVRVEGRLVLHHTAGLARLQPARPAVPDQPYDLASLTKPLAGALAAAALVERGRLSLDAPLTRWWPELDGRMRVEHLLQHTSGLPAWAPLHERVPREMWGTTPGRQRLLQQARAVPLQGEPGRDYLYSDLGFLVLLELVEQVADQRLDDQLAPWLGEDLRWGWPGAAATEDRPDRGGQDVAAACRGAARAAGRGRRWRARGRLDGAHARRLLGAPLAAGRAGASRLHRHERVDGPRSARGGGSSDQPAPPSRRSHRHPGRAPPRTRRRGRCPRVG
jgi:CubicO group peptidase (beta-lactamase class C family)